MDKIENQIHHQKIIDKLNELVKGYNEIMENYKEIMINVISMKAWMRLRDK